MRPTHPGWKKEHIFCLYLVYTKPFILKYLYSKAPSGLRVELGTNKYTYVQNNKKLTADIVTHIYSAFRDLGVVFEIDSFLVVPK